MGQIRGDVLDAHGITSSRGFLPESDPLRAFETGDHDPDIARYLEELDRLGDALPELLDDGMFREVGDALPSPPPGTFDELSTEEVKRLCLLASFFASGYVHQTGDGEVDRLPAGIAIPLYHSSKRIGRKPIAAYDTICLRNYELIDDTHGFQVENIRPVQRFTDLADETWFVAIHVAIEAAAGEALTACALAQEAIEAGNPAEVHSALSDIETSLERQTAIMQRMTEGNDPQAFVDGFRPYYQGFDGIVFEGVSAIASEPQHLRGGSGAQSSALPSIDAAFGIDHEQTELIDKLDDMRSYMPAVHREAIEAFADGPDILAFVQSTGDPELVDAFNRCIDGIVAFREVHFTQVAQYIRELAEDATGTGGTDYMTFLPKMKHETERQRLPMP